MSWDAFQQEALVELGLPPYRLAVVAPPPPEGLPPALFAALQHAAGAGHAAVAGLPGLEAMQGNPAAKRALWPSLRRLRATGR